MIITRTPYRISFFGGGTDYPLWYEQNGGAVLSTTINKYCYITCRFFPPFFKYNHRIVYSQQEMVNAIDEIDHPSVRETFRYFKIKKGIEVHHNGDLPAMSGLGSSSAFTVGLIHALSALNGAMITKRELALRAIHIEQKLIGENVGSQDQTAAAFGGFNVIKFGGPQKIAVSPIIITPKRLELLQSHLMLFFTDFARKASEIASEQIKNIPQKTQELTTMSSIVNEGIHVIQSNTSILEFGKLLHEAWQLKRGFSTKISTPIIDDIYETARNAGALGGKLLGAGGGGFMLIFAKPEAQPRIKAKLKKLLLVPVSFEHIGSQIVYYAPSHIIS